jgi:hypothetical protein
MAYDEKLLKALDEAMAPNGKLDDKAFKFFFDEWIETLATFTEPDPSDEDEYGPWRDSTMKHQVFDYWGTVRPKNAGNAEAWKNKNDLAWVLTDAASFDAEIKQDILKTIQEFTRKHAKADK